METRINISVCIMSLTISGLKVIKFISNAVKIEPVCITPKKTNLSPLSIFIREHTCVLFKAGGKIAGTAVAETLGNVCNIHISI